MIYNLNESIQIIEKRIIYKNKIYPNFMHSYLSIHYLIEVQNFEQ